MAVQTAQAIDFDSMKSIGLKTLSQVVYGFVAGAFSAKTDGLGTNAAAAFTMNFVALAGTLGFGARLAGAAVNFGIEEWSNSQEDDLYNAVLNSEASLFKVKE